MDNQTSTPAPLEPKVSPTYTMNTAPQVPTPVTPPPITTPPPVIPPVPPASPTPSGDHKEIRVILPALLLVLILGALYYWYTGRKAAPVVTPNQTATSTGTTAPGVHLIQVDLTNPAQVSKVPKGFPTDIPVEPSNIKESYAAVYSYRGVTQFTVSYNSQKSKDELWGIYNDFLTKAKYVVSTTTNKTQGVIDASKDGDSLDIVITKQGTGNLVQLTYLKMPVVINATSTQAQ